jgi:hypothetical protein
MSSPERCTSIELLSAGGCCAEIVLGAGDSLIGCSDDKTAFEDGSIKVQKGK